MVPLLIHIALSCLTCLIGFGAWEWKIRKGEL